jgi:hypothetical protein
VTCSARACRATRRAGSAPAGPRHRRREQGVFALAPPLHVISALPAESRARRRGECGATTVCRSVFPPTVSRGAWSGSPGTAAPTAKWLWHIPCTLSRPGDASPDGPGGEPGRGEMQTERVVGRASSESESGAPDLPPDAGPQTGHRPDSHTVRAASPEPGTIAAVSRLDHLLDFTATARMLPISALGILIGGRAIRSSRTTTSRFASSCTGWRRPASPDGRWSGVTGSSSA